MLNITGIQLSNGNICSLQDDSIHRALKTSKWVLTGLNNYTYGIIAKPTSPFCYAKWFINLDSDVNTLTDGMLILIKVPIDSDALGNCISIDGGEVFKPIVVENDILLRNEFSSGCNLLLIYDSTISILIYEDSDTLKTINGAWQVLNIYNNITKNVDSDDITIIENDNVFMYKLKDRNSINGMGYVILRNNCTLYEQLDASLNGMPNTIYEIRYDFDLSADTESNINIPNNSILFFNGGKISNGTINFNNTYIDAPLYTIFDNTKLYGTLTNEEYNVRWSGISSNNPAINASSIMMDYLLNLNCTLKFGNGRYYLDEFYMDNYSIDKHGWNGINFSIKGESELLVEKTIFAPFREGQRYLMKFGGSKDHFGDVSIANLTRAYRISVKGITVTSSSGSYKLTNNINSDDRFEGGYIIYDSVERAILSVSGYEIYNVPLVSFGYSYEVHCYYLNCYGNHCKSKCPVILFFSYSDNNSGPITAFTIEEIKTECLCGPIIGACEHALINELIINNINVEGSQYWEHKYLTEVLCDDNVTKPLRDQAKTNEELYNELLNYNMIPFFRLYNGSVTINNFYSGNTDILWTNSEDNSDAVCTNIIYEAIGFGSKLTILNHHYSCIPVYIIKAPNNLNGILNYTYINTDVKPLSYHLIGNNMLVDMNYKPVNEILICTESTHFMGLDLHSFMNPIKEIKNMGSYYFSNNAVIIPTGNNDITNIIGTKFTISHDILMQLHIKCASKCTITPFIIYHYNDGTTKTQETKIHIETVNVYLYSDIPLEYKLNLEYIEILKGNSLNLILYIDSISFSEIKMKSGLYIYKPATTASSGSAPAVYYACGYIPIGYPYFCTDRQTIDEESTKGIVIYYKGMDLNNKDIWVDALGRTIL